MFEDKRQAYLKFIQYLILAGNSIKMFDDSGNVEGTLEELEETKKKIEVAVSDDALDDAINKFL